MNKSRLIGKRIGMTLYIHKSALHVLDNELVKLVENAIKYIPNDFGNYEIIKIDRHSKDISFIKSPNWNTADEPVVGDSCRIFAKVNAVKVFKGRKTNKQIYHHKWLFVLDDYSGFNVEQSKKRSADIEAFIVANKLNIDYKRIGNSDYWNEHVIIPFEKSKLI